MYVGAHVGTSGGLDKAIERGKAIGAEALQIFPSAPVQWKIRGWSDEDCAKFKETWPEHFKQIIFHGIYLANLAGESADNLEKTKTALIETLQLASKLGIVGTVFHPGSYTDKEIKKKDQIKDTINQILKETPSDTKLIFENTAGSTMGGKLEDLAFLIDVSSDKDRVGVCLDTCHAFAAGYDISNEVGYKKYIKQVDELIGLDKVFCWHFNDSKFGLGEKRDRHENIGEGKLGKTAFDLILNDSIWSDKSGYLEVPGFDNQGPDKKNVEILKTLRR